MSWISRIRLTGPIVL